MPRGLYVIDRIVVAVEAVALKWIEYVPEWTGDCTAVGWIPELPLGRLEGRSFDVQLVFNCSGTEILFPLSPAIWKPLPRSWSVRNTAL